MTGEVVVVPDFICSADILIGTNFLSQPHVMFVKNIHGIKLSHLPYDTTNDNSISVFTNSTNQSKLLIQWLRLAITEKKIY